MAFTGKDPKDTYLAVLNLGDANEVLHATVPEPVLDAAGNSSILGLSQNAIEFIGVLMADVASGIVVDTGIDFEADAVTTSSVLYQADTAVGVLWTTGDPEGSLTAGIGSLALRDDGTAGATLYVKESGVGNTGWVPFDFVTDFLDLGDTPGTFTADKWLKVNGGGTDIEWTDADFIPLVATPAQGELLFYTGAAWDALAVGTSGYVLTTNGAASDPTWEVWDALPAGNHGSVIYHGGATWDALTAGTSGQVLTTQGGAADPIWADVDALPSAIQGEIIYHTGAVWTTLGTGTADQVLTTNGVGANPTWEDAGGGAGDFLSLTDVDPSSYTGQGGKLVVVNATPDGLEFAPTTVVNGAFTDMPSNYASDGVIVYSNGTDAWQYQSIGFFLHEKLVNPNPADGEIIQADSGGTRWVDNVLLDHADFPADYSGATRGLLAVNTGESDIEFVAADPNDNQILRFDAGGGNWAAGRKMIEGSGSPESSVDGDPGDFYTRDDGSTTDILYVKATGTGNTGWALVTSTTAT